MRKRKFGILVAVVLAAGVVPAAATPGTGVTKTDLARATISEPVSASATGESDLVGEMVTVPAGGFVPWHSHPGANFVAVKSGALSVAVSGDQGCTVSTYSAAKGYLEHMGKIHSARNEGSTPAEVYVTQIAMPVGAEGRKAEANPGTANCPADPAGSPAPTVTNIVRAKVSAPFSINATGATDLAMDTVVLQPGGTAGWHSHPGTNFVAVKSGTVTLYQGTAAGCTSQSYSAGQVYIEPVDAAHVSRNDGTTPAEVYVTQVAAPVGAALRGDQQSPGAANCPDTVQAATQLPRTGSPPAGLLVTLAAGLAIAGSATRFLARRR
jgi:quercetin dioxygenase-like cupin family protein